MHDTRNRGDPYGGGPRDGRRLGKGPPQGAAPGRARTKKSAPDARRVRYNERAASSHTLNSNPGPNDRRTQPFPPPASAVCVPLFLSFRFCPLVALAGTSAPPPPPPRPSPADFPPTPSASCAAQAAAMSGQPDKARAAGPHCAEKVYPLPSSGEQVSSVPSTESIALEPRRSSAAFRGRASARRARSDLRTPPSGPLAARHPSARSRSDAISASRTGRFAGGAYNSGGGVFEVKPSRGTPLPVVVAPVACGAPDGSPPVRSRPTRSALFQPASGASCSRPPPPPLFPPLPLPAGGGVPGSRTRRDGRPLAGRVIMR